ncbi:hypothetical protein V8G54_012121 [Vigna mungo]|uniref:Uncharacterized protein n=1 Tax=Vigna mungo TaxID=3915 RepID=A0AAQ3NRN0_VIGMU
MPCPSIKSSSTSTTSNLCITSSGVSSSQTGDQFLYMAQTSPFLGYIQIAPSAPVLHLTLWEKKLGELQISGLLNLKSPQIFENPEATHLMGSSLLLVFGLSQLIFILNGFREMMPQIMA